MQPMGRKPSHANHKDHHPPKGYTNWWEADGCGDENKKAARGDAKKEIKKELEEIQCLTRL